MRSATLGAESPTSRASTATGVRPSPASAARIRASTSSSSAFFVRRLLGEDCLTIAGFMAATLDRFMVNSPFYSFIMTLDARTIRDLERRRPDTAAPALVRRQRDLPLRGAGLRRASLCQGRSARRRMAAHRLGGGDL